MICVSLPLTEFALRFRFAHCIELEKEPNSQAGDLLRPVRLTSRGVSAETLPLCRYSQPHRCRTKKPTWYSSPLSVSAPHISKSTHNTRATASAYSTSMFNGGDLRALSDLLREAEGISSDSVRNSAKHMLIDTRKSRMISYSPLYALHHPLGY